MNDHREHDDLEERAPTLHRLHGRDPFRVPADFFEHFPHQVQATVVERGRSSAWPRLFQSAGWRIAGIGIATAMVLLLLRTWSPDGTALGEVADLQDEEVFDQDLWIEDAWYLFDEPHDLMAEAAVGWSDDEIAYYLLSNDLPLDLLTERP